MTGVIITRPCEDTETHKECHVEMKTKMGRTGLQAKICQELLATIRSEERGMNGFSLRPSRRNQPC